MQERTVTIDRAHVPALARLHRFRHAKSDRVRGHLSAAGGAEGPLRAQDHHACPERDDELDLARRMLGHDSPEAALASGVVQPLLTMRATRRSAQHAGTTRRARRNARLYAGRRPRHAHHETMLVGAGPRATQSLLMASRATAALGRPRLRQSRRCARHGAARAGASPHPAARVRDRRPFHRRSAASKSSKPYPFPDDRSPRQPASCSPRSR